MSIGLARSGLESDDGQAIRLLNEQLKELEIIRGLNYKDPHFKAWRAQTRSYLKRFLPPGSEHLTTFPQHFHRRVSTDAPWGSPKATRLRKLDEGHFMDSCKTAEATIKAVMKHIEEFGIHVERPVIKRAATQSGLHQNYYGNVTIQNQAVATDNAIQKIEHMGDTTGSSLKEIADLFQQSQDLTPRQVKEGLVGIQTLAVEVQKSESTRNWKSVLDSGQVVLTLADKATDLAHKLAPHLPAVYSLMERAKHILGGN